MTSKFWSLARTSALAKGFLSSHCPWVYNCIGINNHRHFFLYLVTLEAGLAFLVRITLGCMCSLVFMSNDDTHKQADFTIISPDSSPTCNILAEPLCRVVNSDPYTLVLMTWGVLQLTWVTMLLFVQLIQISRAMTTWENMKGADYGHSSAASEAITSALTTGTTSRAGAQIGSPGFGPDPALPAAHGPHGHRHHKTGCFAQWKKILGVDTFVETALDYKAGKNTRRNRNPFSSGCVGNCKDFWCDPAPVFGRRENGAAMLGGQVVDYTAMYETPRLVMGARRRGAAQYESVPSEEGV